MAASPAKIIGYADRFSAQPGETIRFMVSCELPAYRAEIVRLIHGDSNPAGPGFKEEPVPTSIGGEYRGRRQEIHAGSYVVVSDSPVMEPVDGLTIQAWIFPTTPEKGLQGIVTKWSSADGAGYGLFIGDGGDLELRVGGVDGVRLLGTGAALRASQWYFVAASYDAERGLATLLQRPLTIWPDDSAADVQAVIGPATPSASGGPAIIGGYRLGDDDGPPSVAGHFNGKIDSPKLFGRALTAPEIEGLRLGGPSSSGLETEALAWWDFARDFSTAHVEDRSGNGLHGRTVNMPGRAFTGHDWDGSEACFRHAPEQYGAIYLHDDDLEDAGWDADFELSRPGEDEERRLRRPPGGRRSSRSRPVLRPSETGNGHGANPVPGADGYIPGLRRVPRLRQRGQRTALRAADWPPAEDGLPRDAGGGVRGGEPAAQHVRPALRRQRRHLLVPPASHTEHEARIPDASARPGRGAPLLLLGRPAPRRLAGEPRGTSTTWRPTTTSTRRARSFWRPI